MKAEASDCRLALFVMSVRDESCMCLYIYVHMCIHTCVYTCTQIYMYIYNNVHI